MRQDHIYLDTKSAEPTIKIVVDILLKKAAAYIKKRKVYIRFGIFGEDNRKRKRSRDIQTAHIRTRTLSEFE